MTLFNIGRNTGNLRIAKAEQEASLAEGFGADEIDVMEVTVVDDVAVAEHGAEALQYAVSCEHVLEPK